jgi:hypothetical protein
MRSVDLQVNGYTPFFGNLSLTREVSLFLQACPTKLALEIALERSWERDAGEMKSKCERR